jgi:hypothetical protein
MTLVETFPASSRKFRTRNDGAPIPSARRLAGLASRIRSRSCRTTTRTSTPPAPTAPVDPRSTISAPSSTTPGTTGRRSSRDAGSRTDEDRLYPAADGPRLHQGLSPRRAVLRLDRRSGRLWQDDRHLLQALLHGRAPGARARRHPAQPRGHRPQHPAAAPRHDAELVELLVQARSGGRVESDRVEVHPEVRRRRVRGPVPAARHPAGRRPRPVARGHVRDHRRVRRNPPGHHRCLVSPVRTLPQRRHGRRDELGHVGLLQPVHRGQLVARLSPRPR